jgi:[ribosomal protein S5]-alanine N-acetyltransferase
MITETTRLKIRKITIEDAAFILRLVNEPSFMENIGDKEVRSLKDARQFILKGSWTCRERPGYGQFLVELKNGGNPVGICGLLYRKPLLVTDIGFAFLPEYWGCGLAYEAAAAVLTYGHSKLGIKKIVGLTAAENLTSIKLLTKLGMKFEKNVKMSDDDPGTVLYA